MKGLKRNWLAPAALATGLLFGQSAQAAVIDFSGAGSSFDAFGDGLVWTADFSGAAPNTGTIVYDDPTGEVTVNGSSNGLGFQSETGISTTATEHGTVSFSWLYESFDLSPAFDVFYWINDGAGTASTQISDSAGSLVQSGAESFLVDAGDIFGFSIITVDNLFFPQLIEHLGQPPR